MEAKLKIVLILTILGILALSFISNLNPPQINIADINEKFLGKRVMLESKIINIQEFPDKSFQILILQDKTGNITATSNSQITLDLNKNQTYIIIGKIQKYNQALQLTIDEIKK
jgi:DNA/RNA endonuclease YhcR with UshA esterase domain